MTKNKITLRLPSAIYQALQRQAVDCDCTATKAAEQILIQSLKPGRRTTEDCLLEVSTNSAAAVLELARIILADTPDEYRRYQKMVMSRTEAGIAKYQGQINEG